MDDELDVVLENEDEELNLNLENDFVNNGTDDYEKLKNKPKINEVELKGNKGFEDLGLSALSNIELENLLK